MPAPNINQKLSLLKHAISTLADSVQQEFSAIKQQVLPQLEQQISHKLNAITIEHQSNLKHSSLTISDLQKQLELSKETDELRYKVFMEEFERSSQIDKQALKQSFKPLFDNLKNMI